LLAGPLAALLALEAWHCARRNGWRFSLAFFSAAVVFGVIRANFVAFACWAGNAPPPYDIRGAGLGLGFAHAVEPFGWAFALYGSWFLAEGTLRRTARWRGEIFPLVLLTTVFMAGFAYAVEAASAPMGWWHWRVANIADPFIYAVPTVGVFDWASVAIDFFLAFLVVECSLYRKSPWRFAVLAVLLVHMVTHVVGYRVWRLGHVYDIWHWVTMWTVGSLALWGGPVLAEVPGTGKRPTLWGGRFDFVPAVAILAMLAIVAYAIVGVSGDLGLLFSLLPLAVGLYLAAPKAPFWPALLLFAAASIYDLRFLPALLPAALVLLYSNRFLRPPAAAARWIGGAVAAAALLLYVPYSMSATTRWEKLARLVRTSTQVQSQGRLDEVLAHQRAAYGLICKYSGGEELLVEIMRTSWLAGDRENFDFAARELETLGPKWRRAQSLWASRSLSVFDGSVDRIRHGQDKPRK